MNKLNINEMNTNIWLLSIILIPFLSSCKKDELSSKNPLLIEEFVYDIHGVVYKIIDDVDSSYNSLVGFVHCVDSIYIKKFHFSGSDNKFDPNYTWFFKVGTLALKHGQYACWRYEYVNSIDMEIGFPNRYQNINVSKFCTYYIKAFFEEPKNDTVYLKLSSIFPLN